MAEYALNVAHNYTAHSIIIDLVGKDNKVLEVGCASGYLSNIFKADGCEVTAIEIDPEQAEKARPYCSRVISGSAEDAAVLAQADGAYDVILFADIIEHLVSPEKTIAHLLPFLKEDGCVIVSVPNVANWRIRLDLLLGKFHYAPEGIMDRTHVRFYTIETIRGLLEQCGLRVDRFIPGATRMPEFLVKAMPSLFAVHLIFRALRADT